MLHTSFILYYSAYIYDLFWLQEFFKDLNELEGKLKELHDASSFLLTVCDEDVASDVTRQVHEIDGRWQKVQRALADQSVYQYDAGMQHVNQWCDSVEIELCRHVTASYDDLNAQNNTLEVSLFGLFTFVFPHNEMT